MDREKRIKEIAERLRAHDEPNGDPFSEKYCYEILRFHAPKDLRFLLDEVKRLENQIVTNHEQEEKVFDAWRKKLNFAVAEIAQLKALLEEAKELCVWILNGDCDECLEAKNLLERIEGKGK